MSEETTREFLARLWKLQDAAGLSNAELARRLGCTPSYIGHMRARRKGRHLGLNFVLAAIRQFPELRSFVVAEFPASNDNVPLSNDAVEEPPS